MTTFQFFGPHTTHIFQAAANQGPEVEVDAVGGKYDGDKKGELISTQPTVSTHIDVAAFLTVDESKDDNDNEDDDDDDDRSPDESDTSVKSAEPEFVDLLTGDASTLFSTTSSFFNGFSTMFDASTEEAKKIDKINKDK